MKNQKLELYKLIHVYYSGVYLLGGILFAAIFLHFEIINSELAINLIGEFVWSHSFLECMIYSFLVLYFISLPHALIVYFNETKCSVQ